MLLMTNDPKPTLSGWQLLHFTPGAPNLAFETWGSTNPDHPTDTADPQKKSLRPSRMGV
jgi:hypothetical protein